MIKVGFLSLAHMHAASYGRALHKRDDVELVGVYDPDRKRGEKGAEQMGTAYFARAEELLGQVDAAIVCSENSLHRKFTELAAQHGVHVLCEKPIATTLEDARAMIAACERAQVKLMIAYPVRYNTPVLRVKEMVERGAVGEVLAIRGTNHGRLPGGWFVEPELSGGGAVLDHTVHVIDLIRWIFQKEFVSVYAEVDSLLYDEDIDDCGLLSLELEGGIFVTQDPSWSRPATYPTWGNVTLKIMGTAGIIHLDAFAQNFLVYNDRENRISEKSFTENMDAGLIADFIEMIKEDRPPSVTGDDGLKSLQVALAAYESARLQRPVQLK